MKTLREATIAVALMAGAVGVPVAASADPPAVAVAPIPGPFVGAPVNTDPNAGQFTVNFDDQGRYLGTGRAAEHYDNFDLGQGRVRQQGRAPEVTPAQERSMVDGLFVSFGRQLRGLANSQSTAEVQK